MHFILIVVLCSDYRCWTQFRINITGGWLANSQSKLHVLVAEEIHHTFQQLVLSSVTERSMGNEDVIAISDC